MTKADFVGVAELGNILQVGKLSFFNNAAYRGSLCKLLSRGPYAAIHRLQSFRLFSSCTVAANKVVQIIEYKTKGGI